MAIPDDCSVMENRDELGCIALPHATTLLHVKVVFIKHFTISIRRVFT
jgi:hypothetical protein